MKYTTAICRERCTKLLSHLKNTGGNIRIFVDEMKFVVVAVACCRSSRMIAVNPAEVPSVMKSKHSDFSMIFDALASSDSFNKYCDPQKVISIQDSTTALGSKKVQRYLKENIPLFVPNVYLALQILSPDLNPCDLNVQRLSEKV